MLEPGVADPFVETDALPTVSELFGEIATTMAVSVATAAVEAGLMVALFVPSFSLVVCDPMVVWLAEVAAPVGRGKLAALTGWVTPEPSTRSPPERLVESAFMVPVVYVGAAVVAVAPESPALDGGAEPVVPTLGFDTVSELLGEMATTSAGSVATAAVEAGFTAAVLVPSLIFVVWLPRVVWFAAVLAPVGRETVPETFVTFHVPDCVAATVPVTVAFKFAAVGCATVKEPVPAFAVTVPLTGCVVALESVRNAPAVVKLRAFAVEFV